MEILVRPCDQLPWPMANLQVKTTSSNTRNHTFVVIGSLYLACVLNFTQLQCPMPQSIMHVISSVNHTYVMFQTSVVCLKRGLYTSHVPPECLLRRLLLTIWTTSGLLLLTLVSHSGYVILALAEAGIGVDLLISAVVHSWDSTSVS